jgi:outer membrane lipase/esterase
MSTFARSGIAAALAALTLLPLLAGAAPAQTLPARPAGIVVFGDSLSDTGNAFEGTLHRTPPSPPYFAGRFSNGPVWVELLAAQFGLAVEPAIRGGTNYAVGGAKTGAGADSLLDQVGLFLAQRGLSHLNPDDLFVVFGGGNDLSDALNSRDPVAVVTTAAANVREIIAELASRGAANFLVPNLPNKGLTPAARARGTPAEEQSLSIAFNAALDTVLSDVTTRLGVTVVRVNLFDLLQNVVAMPGTFGFSNVTNPCLVPQGSGFSVCATPDTFVFWDDIHPTAHGHALIASAAIAAYRLAAPPSGAAAVASDRSLRFPASLVEDVKRELDRVVSRSLR